MCRTCQEIHVKISAREQLSKATLAVREALHDLRWCDHRLRTFEGRRGALLTVDRIGRRLRLKPHFDCIERICGNGICSHWVREPGFISGNACLAAVDGHSRPTMVTEIPPHVPARMSLAALSVPVLSAIAARRRRRLLYLDGSLLGAILAVVSSSCFGKAFPCRFDFLAFSRECGNSCGNALPVREFRCARHANKVQSRVWPESFGRLNRRNRQTVRPRRIG